MLSTFGNTPLRDRVIVALDCEIDRALWLADELKGKATWMKVGMTLFYASGPHVVHELKERGFKVFLDLKLHDIPHQVEGAAASAVASGADMLTVHAAGGEEMMRAARRGAERAASDHGVAVPAILGITVLTSMDDAALVATGVTRPLPDQVMALAGQASHAGMSGVVASPREAAFLREKLGPDAFLVTPGVRPPGSARGDQSRVATPTEAFDAGASHIVIGRPITQAADPVDAFESIASAL